MNITTGNRNPKPEDETWVSHVLEPGSVHEGQHISHRKPPSIHGRLGPPLVKITACGRPFCVAKLALFMNDEMPADILLTPQSNSRLRGSGTPKSPSSSQSQSESLDNSKEQLRNA